jgi:hypothetical protein
MIVAEAKTSGMRPLRFGMSLPFPNAFGLPTAEGPKAAIVRSPLA